MKMKLVYVIAFVVLIHAVGLGLLFIQGCGTARAPEPSSNVTAAPPEEVVMPPPAVEAQEPMQVKEVKHPAQWPEASSTHVVVQGESLSTIAKKYGLTTSEIAALNGISKEKKLRVGQKLILPAALDIKNVEMPPTETHTVAPSEAAKPKPVMTTKTEAKPAAGEAEYVVRRGDSLSVIAKRFGIKTSALRSANGLKSDRILVGQKLVVPGGAMKPAETMPAAPAEAAPKAPQARHVPARVTPAANKPSTPMPAAAEVVAPVPASPAPTAVKAPPAAPTPVAPAPAQATATTGKAPLFRTYVVEQDQDLYSVAMMWGVSPAKIKELNGLTDTKLTPGQRLKIPLSDQP